MIGAVATLYSGPGGGGEPSWRRRELLCAIDGGLDALVPLRRVLLRGRLSRQRRPAPRQRDLGQSLPEPVRISAGGRALVFDGQRALGVLQPRSGLRPRVPRGKVRATPDKARRRSRPG